MRPGNHRIYFSLRDSASKGSSIVQNRKGLKLGEVRQDLRAGPVAAPSAAQRAAKRCRICSGARAERVVQLEVEIRIPMTMRS